MSEAVTTRVCFLLEHEIRAAAKALRRAGDLFDESSSATPEERRDALFEALNTALAALYHASNDESALVLTNARRLLGAPRRRKPAS